VNGTACTLQIGSFTFFRKDALEFYWRDPEPEAPEKLDPIRINVTDKDWAAYYTHALALEDQAKDRLLADQFQAADITVEIHPELRPLLFEGRWGEARQRALGLNKIFVKEGYKADGVRVLVGDSWPVRTRPVRVRV